MSKYSGFILAVMLVLICLWINICRYPSVWRMLQGQYEPQSSAKLEREPGDDHKSEVGETESKGKSEQPSDPGSKGQKTQRPQGTVVSNDTSNPYKTVSFDSEKSGPGYARGPIPVVPAPRVQSTPPDSSGKEEKKNRSRKDSGDDPEDNTLSGRVFRPATLTKPVANDSPGQEAPSIEQKSSLHKDSDSDDDTKSDDSKSDLAEDEANGYVSVMVPAEKAQLATQRSGIRLTSGSSSPIYRPVGAEGTIPMNYDQPRYGI